MTHLSQHQLIDYLLNELPASSNIPDLSSDIEASSSHHGGTVEGLLENRTNENSALLWDRRHLPGKLPWLQSSNARIDLLHSADGLPDSVYEELTSPFIGSNALEIATIASAKNFLSQQAVQKMVNDIWSGDIVFWESLNLHSKKKAQIYNKRYARYLVVS